MSQNELPLTNANALASLIAGNNSLSNQDHINRVSGIEGMNSFYTKASSDYALFEETCDIFCIKSTDAANVPSYRYFSFKEITKDEVLRQISPYLMKGDFDELKGDILSSIRDELSVFKEEILNAQQSIRKQSTYTNNGNKSNSSS